MTKDKIIDIMQKHWHQDGYYTASFDSDDCAGELLSLTEQEKRKLAKEIFLLLQSRFCAEGTSDGWEYSISKLAFEQIALDNFGIDIKNIGESEENKDDETRDN